MGRRYSQRPQPGHMKKRRKEAWLYIRQGVSCFLPHFAEKEKKFSRRIKAAEEPRPGPVNGSAETGCAKSQPAVAAVVRLTREGGCRRVQTRVPVAFWPNQRSFGQRREVLAPGPGGTRHGARGSDQCAAAARPGCPRRRQPAAGAAPPGTNRLVGDRGSDRKPPRAGSA